MKKNIFIYALLALLTIGCTSKKQPAGDPTNEASNPEGTATQTATLEGTEVPPVLAVSVNGLPLFAPFNEGDLMGSGQALRETPEKYTLFLLGESSFEVNYKEEKNKQLANDESYLNQYIYQSKDKMKGQVYAYADAKAVEKYMSTHGDMTAEGEVIPRTYAEGILVSADYMEGRSLLNFYPTTTEDPDGPQFSPDIIAQVEKQLGAKVEKNRIVNVIGDEEYYFGIMTTQPNDKYGIAVWVLAKGNDLCLKTDTCEVDKEEGRVYWSSFDPDEYMEPVVIAVVKGADGLDIYCMHATTDETMNYMLMRQKGNKMQKYDMGGFYQQYE